MTDVLSLHYSDSPEDSRLAELFTDFLCWCRESGNHPFSILSQSLSSVGLSIAPEEAGLNFYGLHHPSIPRERKQDKPSPTPVSDRAKRFERIITAHTAASAEPETEAAAMLISEVLPPVDTLNEIFYVIASSDKRYSRLFGVGFYSDEFYSESELLAYFKDADLVERIINGIGRNEDPDSLYSGQAVMDWITENHQTSSEDGDEDS